MTIQPARGVQGTLRLPGDKSISHRYAMLAALAPGKSVLQNFSSGADCASTLGCLRALGVGIAHGDRQAEIAGGELRPPAGALDCGNSGSTMRMLAGILAGQSFGCELRGDGSLSRRPMARITRPLGLMGAEIVSAPGERPPLQLRGAGARLQGISHQLEVASAQVKTCLLFAGLQAQGETTVTETVRTRDHGELALGAFGAEVTHGRGRVSIRGGQTLHPIEARIPGDISSAAFFMCAAAILPGSSLVIEDLLLNPTRAAIVDVLVALGAKINMVEMSQHHGELTGTIKIESGKLKGARITGAQAVALMDELPVLAAIAPYTQEGIEVRGAAELRVKESDRIAVVAKNLRAMAAEVEELADGWRIPGGQKLRGASIDSAGDHRIAMAFSVAALGAQGESEIRGAEAVSISFPEFFSLLGSVAQT